MTRASLARALLVGTLALACAPHAIPPTTASARVVTRDWPSDGAPPPSVHASTMAEVNGILTAAWFAGAYESAKDVGIWFTRQERGAWVTPMELANGVQPDGSRHPTWASGQQPQS